MLHKVLNEARFPDEQKDTEDFDAVSPNFFGFDGELTIWEQGFEDFPCSVALFEIGLKSRERHEWTVHSWHWTECTHDALAAKPSHELGNGGIPVWLSGWVGHDVGLCAQSRASNTWDDIRDARERCD
jgi:hypothetical protein